MKLKHNHIPVVFHPDQLDHSPRYEWSFGTVSTHPESTARMQSIINALGENSAQFPILTPRKIPLKLLRQVHDSDLITLYKSAMEIERGETFYPTIFPQRTHAKANPKNIHHAGFYCYDAGTPLTANTWSAAAWSAASGLYAAQLVASGKHRAAYALCRPPGHHASRGLFGGYCYFNNAALIATRYMEDGNIVILDIDFHHGNGTQSLFYDTDQVLYVSIHGDPEKYYPFFTGYASERGFGAGKGYNINISLPTGTSGVEYMEVLESKVLPKIRARKPAMLIISAGFDTYISDPIGAFSLVEEDYRELGGRLASLELPTVVVQEGGYDAPNLGRNVRGFLEGFQGTMRT